LLKDPPTAEISPPGEKSEERYKRKLKYVIKRRKDQLEKETEKRFID
jgi:hypothetical protein